jgi:hypothetical protein
MTILGGPTPLEDRKQMIELLLADGADIDNHQPGLDVIPVMLAPGNGRVLVRARRQQEGEIDWRPAGTLVRVQQLR